MTKIVNGWTDFGSASGAGQNGKPKGPIKVGSVGYPPVKKDLTYVALLTSHVKLNIHIFVLLRESGVTDPRIERTRL